MAGLRHVMAGTGTTRVMYNLPRTALAHREWTHSPRGELMRGKLMATAKKPAAKKKVAKKTTAKKPAAKKK